jgi:hypothetical protein
MEDVLQMKLSDNLLMAPMPIIIDDFVDLLSGNLKSLKKASEQMKMVHTRHCSHITKSGLHAAVLVSRKG